MSSHADTPETASSVPQGMRCPNCSAAVEGTFCSTCGQRLRHGRLTVRGVTGRVITHFFSFDRGFFRTVRDLLLRPAGVVSDYLSGRTRPYMEPAQFFLLNISAAQLVSWWVGSFRDIARGMVDAAARAAADVDILAIALDRYYITLGLVLVPVLAICTRLVFHRRGLNLAEHLVFHLYLLGQAALVWIVMIMLDVLPNPAGYLLVGLIFAAGVGFYIWTGSRFFGQSRLSGAAGMAASMVAAFIFLIILMAVGAVLIMA